MQVPANDHATEPIGPPADASASRAPAGSNPRLTAAIVFAICSAILLTAWWLTPNTDTGVGTHEALGLPPCGLEAATGIPCATCGMTTSFSLMAHGRFVAAFVNQPAGALLALITAMTWLLSGYALLSGMSLSPIGRVVWQPRVMVIGAVILVLAWVYKIIIHTGMIGVSL